LLARTGVGRLEPPVPIVLPQLVGDLVDRVRAEWRVAAVKAPDEGVDEVLRVRVDARLLVGRAMERGRILGAVSAVGAVQLAVGIVLGEREGLGQGLSGRARGGGEGAGCRGAAPALLRLLQLSLNCLDGLNDGRRSL